MPAFLEHANVTVSDPDRTAAQLGRIFGWRIRWKGDSIYGGTSIHVGSDDSYLALYSRGAAQAEAPDSYNTIAGLNHLAVVVEDLDATEDRVRAAGFTPRSHADYEPGRRFYYTDDDGIEFEVVSYAP